VHEVIRKSEIVKKVTEMVVIALLELFHITDQDRGGTFVDSCALKCSTALSSISRAATCSNTIGASLY
jgi:hypothetical protein